MNMVDILVLNWKRWKTGGSGASEEWIKLETIWEAIACEPKQQSRKGCRTR